ncbi:MAG: STAS domain-containing protein [Planctomycetota bacterium]
MKVERKQWGDVTILSFVGEFDAYNLPTFSGRIDNLIETGNVRLVFNLRLMTFINSGALGYLVRTKKLVEEHGGDLVIITPSKFVRKALTVLGLHEYFKIYETEQEGVLFFHKAGEVTEMELDKVEPDEKLRGENAIMFRLRDEKGAELLGPAPFVGKISSLYADGLQYRWEVPKSGGRSQLTTENFDELIHPGRALSVKFRQPFVAKTKYFEADAAVMKVNKDIDDGVTEAMIHISYTKMNQADRKLLEDYAADLDEYRGELKGD